MNYIRKWDLFGHAIQLSFNQKGSEHQTFLGGCVSIVVRSFMIFYTYHTVTRMVSHQSDSLSTVLLPTLFEELGEVNVNDTQNTLIV